jgi:ADP-heptose:LPS heptosyltransferase
MGSKLLYQGSENAIGDLLLGAHSMYNQRLLGRTVSVMIPKGVRPELKDLYYRCTFLQEVIEVETPNIYIDFCSKNGYDSTFWLQDKNILKNIPFHPLNEWFKYDTKPTISAGYVGFQVASSSFYDRPIITHFKSYLETLHTFNLNPVFFGAKKDEELFNKNYPDVKSTIPDVCWRFGKDSLLQTLANLKTLRGHYAFSSWTAYGAVLQGTPTIELWNDHQWQAYSSVVRTLLGNPIHYSQDSFWGSPSPYPVEVFDYLKKYSDNIYQF